jgi:hypothetical protein
MGGSSAAKYFAQSERNFDLNVISMADLLFGLFSVRHPPRGCGHYFASPSL